MMHSRLNGWRGWTARTTLWTWCAGAVLGLTVLAAGCAGMEPVNPEPGGSKGPEMKATMTQGPRSASASQMNQSTPTPGEAVSPIPCGQGLACTGTFGCVGACDPNAGMQTACATCDNSTLANCMQRACTP